MDYEATFAGHGRPARLTVSADQARQLLSWVRRRNTDMTGADETAHTVVGRTEGNTRAARLTDPDQFVALDPWLDP